VALGSSSSMRQPGSGRAAGSPLLGWLSGAWDAAGNQQSGSCQDSSCASVSPSGASECAGVAQQNSGCSCSEVCNLRAASCPPCSNCRQQQHTSQEQQHQQQQLESCVQPQLVTLPALRAGTASLKGRVSVTPSCSTPRATMTPRTPATGVVDYGQAASQCSTGGGDSGIRGGQRGVSFAEELHQHLNTFKSFVFRSTSVHLLGSRCASAMLFSGLTQL
jgi:hypothetical protein